MNFLLFGLMMYAFIGVTLSTALAVMKDDTPYAITGRTCWWLGMNWALLFSLGRRWSASRWLQAGMSPADRRFYVTTV